jgi:hypothetical protein
MKLLGFASLLTIVRLFLANRKEKSFLERKTLQIEPGGLFVPTSLPIRAVPASDTCCFERFFDGMS